MTRQGFINQFGEDPVDMFGEDWKNYIDDFIEEVKVDEYAENYS